METESCGLFLECTFVALVLEDDLLTKLLTGHPHYDLSIVSLVRSHHQMEVVTIVEQFNLCFNNVVLVVHSKKLDTVVCLFLRWIVLHLLFLFFYALLLNFLIMVYVGYNFVLMILYFGDLSILVQETNPMFFGIFKGSFINISI